MGPNFPIFISSSVQHKSTPELFQFQPRVDGQRPEVGARGRKLVQAGAAAAVPGAAIVLVWSSGSFETVRMMH